MHKRTKIIATLGPASSDRKTIRAMIEAGANIFRLNFSHGDADEHRQRCRAAREVARELGAQIGILGDLQGPKIRIAGFRNGPVNLEAGAEFVLDCELDTTAGNAGTVGVTYVQLPRDCRPGQHLLLDDGRIELSVTRVDGSKILTKVVTGGTLSANKGINLRGGGLSAPALTDKDFRDMALAAELDVDYLAVSFPRSAEDMLKARKAADEAGCDAKLIAKVERAEAVATDEALDDIIRVSDAVMVARGDLGVEIGDAELIGVQKRMISHARQLNRVVITATQMMETMIENPMPTRAEVFDVANAVLDGTDAVMLSAETAAGKYPVAVVAAMTRIIRGAEKQPYNRHSARLLDRQSERTDEAVAMAAMYTANHMGSVKAILSLTESGSTPLWMSRVRSGITIYGISRNQKTLNAMCLFRGVEPMLISDELSDTQSTLDSAIARLKAQGALHSDDLVLSSFGNVFGRGGETNTLKIICVE
jgi:pyruvate kinase